MSDGTFNLDGFVFGKPSRSQHKRKENYTGRVVIDTYSSFNGRNLDEYRYLRIWIGLDIIEKIGGCEGKIIRFGVHPEKQDAAVFLLEEQAGGLKFKIQEKRNNALFFQVPQAMCQMEIPKDMDKVDVKFNTGRPRQKGAEHLKGVYFDLGGAVQDALAEEASDFSIPKQRRIL